ncbi:sensor domain-containing diguanylate cyclase [Sedimenticola hydrogenitrophicus]|uniref:sensor domain-containing diguanylate cyclase n=1 Tax=Sedimenticola hydrogenitrophicus TaxID=2967975 RepID=UPI0021A87C8F|nr:sensor domain-containing diguanylate cyclase [Sedimenticola hydrogenitrophicus]
MKKGPSKHSTQPDDPIRELQAKADRFDRFTRNVPAMLYDYVIDQQGASHCLYCSAYSLELLGVPPGDFVRDMRKFWDMIHPDDLLAFRKADQTSNKQSEVFSMDVRVVLASGEEKWIRISSKRNPPVGDAPAIWSGYMIDISETKKLEKMLQEQASHDFLTGLVNRHYFHEYFHSELMRKERYQSHSVLLMLDLDHFKTINDEFGHDAGDYVLKTVSKLIQAQMRAVDVLARWGGEEFCILLPETTQAAAGAVAERIRASLEQYLFEYQRVPIKVTTSIGLTALTARDKRIEEVVQRADQALYQAKRDGRNRVTSR